METIAIFLAGLAIFEETDKKKHFAIGAVTSAYVKHKTGNPLNGCLAAAALGLGKEFYDRHHAGEFDVRDLWATSVGCVVTIRF
ncbi:MAG: hypothetical protein ABJI96_01890 [Paracoccaceae bacterium]